MSFLTRREKLAYVKGIKKGFRNKKKKRKKTNFKKRKKTVSEGAYNSRGKINENLVDDLHGPVVFF